MGEVLHILRNDAGNLRLMGKEMLVTLMMEGKFSGGGLQTFDADKDLMSALAWGLVE
jgi:hypothetical protein